MNGIATDAGNWPRHGAGATSILITLACAAAAVFASALGDKAALACGAAFFLAGLGHGAAVEDTTGLRRYSLIEAGAYGVFALAIAAVCLVAPTAGLISFLALSAWHFSFAHYGAGRSADNPIGALALGWIAIGGSAVFWPATTTQIFADIIGEPFPDWALVSLRALGVCGMLLGALAVLQRDEEAWMLILGVLATLAFPPILAVGFVFFVLHAMPETRRQVARFGLKHVVRATFLPVLLACVGAVIVGYYIVSGTIPFALAAALAIGLATPHMIAGDLRG